MEGELKPAPNQVAGHRFDEGRQGSLVDAQGRFYKPLQSRERGDAEAAFYTALAADAFVPAPVRAAFPAFHGVREGPSAAGGVARFLAMEDLTAGYAKPCVMDIKMGRKTWYEGAPQSYIDKCLVKDAETTSGALGYRIAGIQTYDARAGEMWRANRKWCKKVAVGDMPAALARFLSADPCTSGALDSGLAESVLGGQEGLLAKLAALRDWFATQTGYQFYSASILIVYEGCPGGGTPEASVDRRVSLRLVDFAHVVYGQGLDTNFLEAIDAVMGAFSSMLNDAK